jgi:signal recognition particle GTPase
MRPLKTKQANETSVVTGKKTKSTLLGHIEKIVELSVDSKLNDEFFDKAKPHVNFVKRRLHLNDMQAVILSHFIDMSADSHILLSEKGMRTGFACLFHGAPGTGKTETVYQIARQIGRDIFPVDIAQTKSMWVWRKRTFNKRTSAYRIQNHLKTATAQ